MYKVLWEKCYFYFHTLFLQCNSEVMNFAEHLNVSSLAQEGYLNAKKFLLFGQVSYKMAKCLLIESDLSIDSYSEIKYNI